MSMTCCSPRHRMEFKFRQGILECMSMKWREYLPGPKQRDLHGFWKLPHADECERDGE